METIYRNSIEQDFIVWEKGEEAHANSILTVAIEMRDLLCNNEDVDDQTTLLAKAKEIAKCCDKLKAACNGKYVKTYKLVK